MSTVTAGAKGQLTYPSWDPPIVLTPRPNTAVVQKIASTSHSWCRPQSCITTDPLSRLTLLSLFFLYSKQISPQSLPIKHPKQLYLFTASSLTGTSKSNTNNMSDNNTNYAQPNTSSNNDTNNGQPSANGGQEKPHPSSVLRNVYMSEEPEQVAPVGPDDVNRSGNDSAYESMDAADVNVPPEQQ